MSNPNHSAPYRRGGFGGGGRGRDRGRGQQLNQPGPDEVQEQGQIDSTHISTNAGNPNDISPNSQTLHPSHPSLFTPIPQKGKSKNKKWAKVDLLDIAPQAGPSLPVQPLRKGNSKNQPRTKELAELQSCGLLIEHRGPAPILERLRNEGPHRGVNIDGESVFDIEDRMKRVSLEIKSKPLTEFHLFPTLAPELRFKIWNLAAHSSARILEIVRHPDYDCPPDYNNLNDLRPYNHTTYRISKPGQKVPGVLQANRESRSEASLVYEKRYLNNYPNHSGDIYPYAASGEFPWTWYNPLADIIFFGEDTCIRTVVNFFYLNSEESYPKVAFRCGNMIGTCPRKCDFDTWEYPHGDNQEMCESGHGIGGGGVGILGALHGKDREIAFNDLVPGAPHTKEVFFVVKTECMKFEAGDMPSDLTFRPAIHQGLTPGQEKTYSNLQGSIQAIRAGEAIPGCGENRWDRGNYPDFKFVSLAPPLKDGRGKVLKHDAIQVPTQDIGKLIYRKNEFLTDLANKTGVEIVPSDKAYVGQKNREIGLYNGTEEGIAKVKEAIREQLKVDFEVYRRGPNYQGAGRSRGPSLQNAGQSRGANHQGTGQAHSGFRRLGGRGRGGEAGRGNHFH